MKNHRSFQSRVLEFVSSREQSTINEVVAALGKHVTSASISRRLETDKKYRTASLRRPLKDPRLVGTRMLITDALKKLIKNGKISRLSVGVYGPK